MAAENALAYYDTATITTVESFSAQHLSFGIMSRVFYKHPPLAFIIERIDTTKNITKFNEYAL
jgi:hypothetical protein